MIQCPRTTGGWRMFMETFGNGPRIAGTMIIKISQYQFNIRVTPGLRMVVMGELLGAAVGPRPPQKQRYPHDPGDEFHGAGRI